MSNIDMNKNSENGSSNYTGDDKFVIKNLNLHYGDFHALKNINIPQFEETVKFISDALEEKEREEFSRMKVIKRTKEQQEQMS